MAEMDRIRLASFMFGLSQADSIPAQCSAESLTISICPAWSSHLPRFKQTRNVGIVQFVGRWKPAATLNRYIQAAMVVLVLSQSSPPIRLHLKSFCHESGFLAMSPW